MPSSSFLTETQTLETDLLKSKNALKNDTETKSNLIHNEDFTVLNGTPKHCDENGSKLIMDDLSLSGGGSILLQPIQNQQALVVSYGPGSGTCTSTLPQIVQLSHNNTVKQRRCYCRVKDIRSRLIILAAAVLVLGTAIGALTMYFTGNYQCTNRPGNC